MPNIPDKLNEIAERVRDGKKPKHTLRSLLGYFGQARRGSVVNYRIAEALAALDLRTEPDFRSAFIDEQLTFVPADTPPVEPPPKGKEQDEEPTEKVYVGKDARRDGSTFRVVRFLNEDKLAQGVTYLRPDDTIQEAITLMLARDYSQIPVMTSERELKGIVSWKSLGSAFGLGEAPKHVRECMESTDSIVDEDDSIFKLLDLVAQNEVALVRARDRRFVTLFTAADLGELYRELSEQFILLGEIEDCIRALLERGRFTAEELAEYRSPDGERPIRRMDDLTFGAYLKIVENSDNWHRLGLAVDRAIVVKDLHEVRTIRNAVMHFDPDGLTPEQVEHLRNVLAFLRRLRRLPPPP